MTEMTKLADILSIASYVAFALAALCLVLAIYFWFMHRIPSVIGDLSGKTARKSIEKMRESNEKSGNKNYKPSYINSQRGKVTETMTDLKKTTSSLAETSGGLGRKKAGKPEEERPETGLLEENRYTVSDVEETMPLGSEAIEMLTEETEMLTEETEMLTEETELLTDGTTALEEEVVTAELTAQPEAHVAAAVPKGKKLTMIDDVMEVHTDYSI